MFLHRGRIPKTFIYLLCFILIWFLFFSNHKENKWLEAIKFTAYLLTYSFTAVFVGLNKLITSSCIMFFGRFLTLTVVSHILALETRALSESRMISHCFDILQTLGAYIWTGESNRPVFDHWRLNQDQWSSAFLFIGSNVTQTQTSWELGICLHVFSNPVTLGTVQNQLTHRTTVNSDWYDKLCCAKLHNGPQLRVQ